MSSDGGIAMSTTSGSLDSLFPVPENLADISIGSYLKYPTSKPFINDDYCCPTEEPILSFPQKNTQALLTALNNLQQKIRSLELERNQAEVHIKELASETDTYKHLLEQGKEQEAATENLVSRQTQEVTLRLNAAENRCLLLEKQLEYMKKMVNDASANKDQLERQKEQQNANGYSMNPQTCGMLPKSVSLDKIAELERDHLKLTVTQKLAENRIKRLEQKLKEEQKQKAFLKEKAAKMETLMATSKVLKDTLNRPCEMQRKRCTKKKKAVISKPGKCSDPSLHYRLNLADIPFVAGKSTSQSHSVSANVQNVFALMKAHNSALCCLPNKQHLESGSSSTASSTLSTNVCTDLHELLMQLQEEFGKLSWEHQQLTSQINECLDPKMKTDLERELDAIVSRMETKGMQINKIHKYIYKTNDDKKQMKRKKSEKVNPVQASAALHEDCNQRTSKKAALYRAQSVPISKITKHGATSTDAAGRSLRILRDMRKLQATLRQDDLSWV